MGGRTSNESKAKYNAKAYDRINIAVRKGYKARIQEAAQRKGQSVNGYINDLIDAALERDGMAGDGIDEGGTFGSGEADDGSI